MPAQTAPSKTNARAVLRQPLCKIGNQNRNYSRTPKDCRWARRRIKKMAKEFVLKESDGYLAGDYTPNEVYALMVEFADMHVKAALQAAYKSARIDVNGEKALVYGFRTSAGVQTSVAIDKHSITNAYPKSNIK